MIDKIKKKVIFKLRSIFIFNVNFLIFVNGCVCLLCSEFVLGNNLFFKYVFDGKYKKEYFIFNVFDIFK